MPGGKQRAGVGAVLLKAAAPTADAAASTAAQPPAAAAAAEQGTPDAEEAAAPPEEAWQQACQHATPQALQLLAEIGVPQASWDSQSVFTAQPSQ